MDEIIVHASVVDELTMQIAKVVSQLNPKDREKLFIRITSLFPEHKFILEAENWEEDYG